MATTTSVRAPGAGRAHLAGRAPTAAFLAGALLCEVILAAAVVDERLLPLLALPVVAGALAVVFRWPFVGMVALLALAASFISRSVASASVGPLDVYGYELALGALLAVAVLAPRRRTWGGAAGGWLAAFLVLVAVSGVAGVLSGRATLVDAQFWGRSFAMLLVFYVVVRLFPERREIERVLTAGAILAALTGAVSLAVTAGLDLTALFGRTASLYVGASESGAGLQNLGDLDRIQLPGIALAYVLLWFAVGRLIGARSGTSRAGWAVVVAGIGCNLALSFNRNMWLGSALGLVALLALGGASLRRPFVVAVGAAATAGMVFLLVSGGVTLERESPIAPIVERGRTLLDPSRLQQEGSLRVRLRESSHAWEAFAEHPVLGVGAGAPFGVYASIWSGRGYERSPQLFLHNQYLYLLLVAGLPGFICFLAFLLAIVGRARRRLADPVVLTCTVGLGMLMISAFVWIAYADPNMATGLALLCGSVFALTGD